MDFETTDFPHTEEKPDSPSPIPIKRDADSVDDFEHLGHENFDQKEAAMTTVVGDIQLGAGDDLLLGNNFSGDLREIINKEVDSRNEGAVIDFLNAERGIIDDFPEPKIELKTTMDAKHLDNIIDNDIPFERKDKEILDQLLTQSTEATKHIDNYEDAEKGAWDAISHKPDKKKEEPPKETFKSVENLVSDDFRDVAEEFQEVIQVEKPKPKEKQEKVKVEAPVEQQPKPKEAKAQVKKPEPSSIEVEVLFCKMGLDTWFNPQKLNPKVEGLIYWRDPKKSGPVFGGVLLVLLALTYFSLISVVAYLSLLGLTGTVSFRIYKNVLQAIQKTGEGHPFKDFLEIDLSLPPEKVKEVSEVVVAHVNAGVSSLRKIFLVEDLIDSIKFGVFMWSLTYVGSWFNGMTLVILAWVALFTLPKVYETNKTQIDANIEIVKSKLAEVTSKVKAAIPLGKKEEKTE